MKITQPSVLIQIPRSWHEGISDEELYEVTRGVWRIGERRERVELAFSVAGGIVREVYRVLSWHPAGSTPCHMRPLGDVCIDGRWEFVGEVAGEGERHSTRAWMCQGGSRRVAVTRYGTSILGDFSFKVIG